jgi:hypothetical protein
LWIDPSGERRDLFWGVGGEKYAPPRDAAYEYAGKDDSGFSVSYDVKGPDGLEWSVKIGPEAQTEVVVSRILWGLGYHQPPVYYLPSWRLRGDPGAPRTSEADEPAQVVPAGRFRPKLPNLDPLDEPWNWLDNPFVGTRQLGGLLVALLILNSTDLKDDNNSLYELPARWDGATRWFVVRDVGASLGETGRLYPRRNWLEGFEQEPFLTEVANGRVQFGYDGGHRELLALAGPDDIRWAARRMSRLTDAQWHDAFRAGGYPRDVAARYIERIRQKVDDGLALRVDARVRLRRGAGAQAVEDR